MRRHKGVALITVLLTAAVLAMLSTALVCMNRNGLLSLGEYENRARAMQACYAGLDYARARLQQDSTWSRTAFAAAHKVLDLPQVVVQESGQTVDANQAEGELPLEDSKFQLRVENNLGNRYSVPAPAWSRSQMTIPPRCALVAIDGLSGGSRRRIEVILCHKVGVGVGIFAGKDLGISLADGAADKALTFSSTLPRGNHVNVNENVLLPSTSKVDFGTQAARGRIQSGGDTKVNSSFGFATDGSIDQSTISGASLAADPLLTQQASTEMKTSINTNSPPSPPRFKPDQLKQPSSSSNLPAGTYRFTSHDTVTFTPSNGGSSTQYVNQIPVGDKVVRLGEYRFMPEGDIKVDGNLTLVGQQTKLEASGDRMVSTSVTTPMPVSLAVGYGTNGLPLAVDDLGNPNVTKTRFTVSGNLKVEGDMVGNGQLFVQKRNGTGGTLTVEGNSRLSATRTDGMAVVVEDSVHFKDVNALAPVQPFAMGTNEFDLYASALNLNAGPPYYSQSQKDTLKNWQSQGPSALAAVIGSDDLPGATVRGRIIGNYTSVLNDILSQGNRNAQLIGTQVVVAQGDPGSSFIATLSAKQLITDYIQQVVSSQGNMTLGTHTRVREFIKSVERGAPNPALLSVWFQAAPVAGLSSTGLNDVSYNSYSTSIQSLVGNQISAYNQDARLHGKTLQQYISSSNGYSDSQRFDFIFGGLLYAQKNIYAHMANRFNLLGTMISAEGSVGFDHLSGGQVVYDPNSFEDQFDLSKVGLSPTFFWMAP
ncbi:hypothetical protein JST97_35265 [bacterium]|nr:hypothetical protein [bacterium]